MTWRRICVECLEDQDCVSAGNDPLFCLPEENFCVECYLDEHCPPETTCDPEHFVCRPETGRELCEPCREDSQCGGNGDICVTFRDEMGREIDRGCGRACVSSDVESCPPGYRCAAAGNLQQCVPHNAEEVPTCAGIRDMGRPCEGIGAAGQKGRL